jgi:hypothetical protein
MRVCKRNPYYSGYEVAAQLLNEFWRFLTPPTTHLPAPDISHERN